MRKGQDRWASFSAKEHPEGRYRHVVAKGYPTSSCGITALPESMWREDNKKTKCPTCVQKEEEGK